MSHVHKWIYAIVTLLLIVGAGTCFKIPFFQVNGPGFTNLFGLDFLNLYVFHHCPDAVENVYKATGEICGDPEGRVMIYPPWLFHAFGWTFFLSYPVALYTWSLLAICMFVGSGAVLWCGLKQANLEVEKIVFSLFWLLLGIQFPMGYAIERANNDIVVLLGGVVSLLLWQQKKWMWLSLSLTIIVAFKLYPIWIFVLVGIALIGKPGFKPYCFFSVVFATILFVTLWGSHLHYIKEVLPLWSAKQLSQSMGMDHILLNANYVLPFSGTAMCLSLLAVGVWLARQSHNEAIVLIYALAVCTFFQKMSFDYNLITTYPLLICLFGLSLAGRNKKTFSQVFSLLIFGLLIFFVLRYFSSFYASYAKYFLMWGWLLITGLFLVSIKEDNQGNQLA